MADSEEPLRSGVRACTDPLKSTCCKARCRTAEWTQKAIRKRPRDRAKRREITDSTWALQSCVWLSRSASILVRESISASILER